MSRDWSSDGHEEGSGKERWLVTYADLITLLLVFFIVMYALSSQVSDTKFDELATSLHTTLKKIDKDKPRKEHAFEADDSKESKRFKATANAVFDALVKTDPKTDVKVDIDERGLVVSLIDTSFFEPGSAVLRPKSHALLLKVSQSLRKLPNEIHVEGHTDAAPIHTAQFPSNWELSSARAAAVVRFLSTRGGVDGDKLSVIGHADRKPIASNGSPEGRKRNRRVDLVIVRKEEKEPIKTGVPLEAPVAVPKRPAHPAHEESSGIANPFGGGFKNPFK